MRSHGALVHPGGSFSRPDHGRRRHGVEAVRLPLTSWPAVHVRTAVPRLSQPRTTGATRVPSAFVAQAHTTTSRRHLPVSELGAEISIAARSSRPAGVAIPHVRYGRCLLTLTINAAICWRPGPGRGRWRGGVRATLSYFAARGRCRLTTMAACWLRPLRRRRRHGASGRTHRR